MTYVYDAATDRSDLVILDADNLAAPSVATIHLPRRVPAGFHGNWLPDDVPPSDAEHDRTAVSRTTAPARG